MNSFARYSLSSSSRPHIRHKIFIESSSSSIKHISFISKRYLSYVSSKIPFSMDHIPDSISYGEFLLQSLSNRLNTDKSIGKSVAIIDGSLTGESLTFQEVYDVSHCLALYLKNKGFVSNDAKHGIAVITPNHKYFLPVMLAISLSGSYAISINPVNTSNEINYQLELAEAKLIFCHSSIMSKISPLAQAMGIQAIAIDSSEMVDIIKANKSASDIDSNHRNPIKNDRIIHNTAIIPFSSGTTGKSKGVVLTNRNIIANILQCMPVEGQDVLSSKYHGSKTGVVMAPLPFYHIYGMVVGMFLANYCGSKLVFQSSFDFKRLLELIQEHRVTRAYLVPPIIIALSKHPIVEDYDLSSLEAIVSAAAPLGGEVQVVCSKRLNVLIKQGWGMTELSPLASLFPDDSIVSMDAIKGKSGILVGGTEGKVVSTADGSDMPHGVEGEILIRGPQVMKGYLKNIEATQSTIRPDGWLHTGDIGYFDSDGALVVTDRSKELIKYKGFQVAPAELEALILTMPQIQDAIVIPVLDDEAGEIPRAYVVKSVHCPLEFNEKDVIEFVNSRCAPYKKLRGGVIFTDSIPKSPSGKLLRRLQIEMDRKNSA